MPLPITVPRLGWSMNEGTFVGWLKKDGESVTAGEPLFTLEGDKAAQEVEAADSGILRIPLDAPKTGEAVSVGTLLGYLLSPEESALTAEELQKSALTACGSATESDVRETAGAIAPSTGEVKSVSTAAPSDLNAPRGLAAAQPPPEPDQTFAPVSISPRARRRAAEFGLDYRRLKGSGRSGRIIEADIVAAVKSTSSAGLSTMRRVIAQRTAESFSRAPHFYLRTEVNAMALWELRERRLPDIERATGIRLTLGDLLLRAQAQALRDCPFANAIWQDHQVVRLANHDVGLVVGLADGLLIPIVRGADSGELIDLVKQRAALVKAARAGQISAEALQGGATSLSNLGNSCVDEFAAVIAPPQSSMLAVGRAAQRPSVADGQLVIRTTLKLCLSVDHRVMDGGPAAQFLGRIVEHIEHPL